MNLPKTPYIITPAQNKPEYSKRNTITKVRREWIVGGRKTSNC